MLPKCQSSDPQVEDGLDLNPSSVPLLAHSRLLQVKPTQVVSSKDPARADAESEDPTDVVTLAIGEYGRWQLLMTFLLSLFSFPCTFHIYLPTFTAQETEFWCKRPDRLSNLSIPEWINYSQPNGACMVRQIPLNVTLESILSHTAPLIDSFEKCTEWQFDRSEVGDTLISEWSLVCDRSNLITLAEVVFLIGVGVGGVLGGWVSDRFGRKRVLMSMLVVQCVLALVSLMVQSYIQYAFVRLLMGLVSVSVVYAAFVLSVELVGGKWVTIAGVCNFFFLPVCYIIVSLVSLILPNWRDLQLSLSLPGCLLLLLWFVLPESPRWLITMGRTQEVKQILEKAAIFNKRKLPADLDKLLMRQKSETKDQQPSVRMLFTNGMLKRTICLYIAWFSMTIGYYGLLLNIGKFKLGNIHSTSIILAVVEIPAIAISIPILLKAGRRLPIFMTSLLCAGACLASEISSSMVCAEWIIVVCLMTGKFAVGATNMMLPIYTAELYPTVIRNMGVGGTQVSAGLALISTPYLWHLSNISKHLPLVTIGALSAVGGAVVLLLPETVAKTKQDACEVNEKGTTNEKDTVSCNGNLTSSDNRGH